MRKSMAFLCAVSCLGFTAGSLPAANIIVNGTFESHPNPDNSTSTFTGWTEATSGNTAVVQSSPALDGSASMHLVGQAAAGDVTQTLPSAITTAFDFNFIFAGLSPSNDGGTTRTMNLFLRDSGSNSDQINFRVILPTSPSNQTAGDVQVFSTSSGAMFHTILSNVVNFSPSLSSPVTNTVDIAGTFNGSSSNYVVTVNGNSTGTLNFFQVSTPTNLDLVDFTTANATTEDYVVDDVVLTTTPEPASLSLLLLASVGLLGRRLRAVNLSA